MTTNFLPETNEQQSQNSNNLPTESEIEAIYDSIEQHAREIHKPHSFQINPRIAMIVLAIVGVGSALLGSADLRVDTTVTFNTPLGERTQPHWLVPKGAKVIRTNTGEGAIKGLGWALGVASGAFLWHVGAKDRRWQHFVGTLQTQWVDSYYKRNQAIVELEGMAAVQMVKDRLDREVKVNLADQRWEFNQAIGYDPLLVESMQPPANQAALPYGKPGTYDEINDPNDKVKSGKDSKGLPDNKDPQKSCDNADRLIANKILKSLAAINTSIFLAAPTRCGKTYSLYKWLGDITSLFPDNEIYVIAQKYEDFPGIPRERVMIFDPLYPEESMRFLGVVYDKLIERKSKPATEATYRERPIKLVLEDWFATHQCLSQKNNSAVWDSIASKLGMIATVGGQYNVGYFICTQSFNIDSSGVADSNIRLNLALLAQGLVRTTSNGEEQGSYGVIEQLINNSRVIASKETRDALQAQLRGLIPQSIAEQTPIILSTIGNPVLGLMPRLNGGNPEQTDDSVVDVASELLEDVWSDSAAKPKPEPSEPPPDKGSGRTSLIGTHDLIKSEPGREPSEPLQGGKFSGLEKLYTVHKLPKNEARVMVQNSLNQRNKTNTIELLWACSKGGSAVYQVAKAEFEELMSEEGQTLT